MKSVATGCSETGDLRIKINSHVGLELVAAICTPRDFVCLFV